MRSSYRPSVYILFSAIAVLAACSGGGGSSGGALPATPGGYFPPGLPGQTASPASTSTGTSSGSPAPGSSGSPPPASGASASPSPAPGTSSSPAPGTSSSPAPGTSSSPAPGSSPTAAPTGYYAQGTVRDIASGSPISGATVVLALPVYAGSTPPPSVSNGSEAITAADGTFTITGVNPGSNFVEVFKSGYASIHKAYAVTQFNNQLGILNLTAVTADEAAWLQQVNADRAQYGGQTVVLDEILQEAAEHWNTYMAQNGYFHADCSQTTDPNCSTATQYEQSAGAQYTHVAQNIAAIGPNSVWQNAESDFVGESANCPQPAAYSTCQGQSNAQDFLNLINPQFVWVGLAEYKNGNTYNPVLGPFLDYYTQEFGTPFQ